MGWLALAGWLGVRLRVLLDGACMCASAHLPCSPRSSPLAPLFPHKRAERVAAPAMLSALSDVLDEDAESFTLKLWQILIYEQLKLTHGGGQ